MKRLLFALLALIVAQGAMAANQKPPDVPTYVAQTVSYAAGTTANALGTGTPPAYAIMPANITQTTTGWITNGANTSWCIVGPSNCGQTKARFQFQATHVLYDDPIRNYGEPGTSHCHLWIGNEVANAYSTYATLRGKPRSLASGGGFGGNASAYWMPCLLKDNAFGDGKRYALPVRGAFVYYEGHHLLNPGNSTTNPRGNEVYFPIGLRFVWGMNMDDPDDLAVKAEIAAANAQPGTASNRYQYQGMGVSGWGCPDTGETKATLPFNTTCPSTSRMTQNAFSPACWDGTNLWSPGGYKHMRQSVYDTLSPNGGDGVCPQGWFRVPTLSLLVDWNQNGDSSSFYLASDAAANAAAGHSVGQAGSFHTDYEYGWDQVLLNRAIDFCMGGNGNIGHECGTDTLDNNAILRSGTLGGDGKPFLTYPQYNTTSPSLMKLVGTQHNGPATIQSH